MGTFQVHPLCIHEGKASVKNSSMTEIGQNDTDNDITVSINEHGLARIVVPGDGHKFSQHHIGMVLIVGARDLEWPSADVKLDSVNTSDPIITGHFLRTMKFHGLVIGYLWRFLVVHYGWNSTGFRFFRFQTLF